MLEGINSRLEEKWFTDPEDRLMESNQPEQERGKKRLIKNENLFRELRDTIKHNNRDFIYITGITE